MRADLLSGNPLEQLAGPQSNQPPAREPPFGVRLFVANSVYGSLALSTASRLLLFGVSHVVVSVSTPGSSRCLEYLAFQ